MAAGNAGAVEQLRAQARACHGAGRFEEAEELYRRVLETARNDIGARHMIGVLKLQQGRAAEALQVLAPLLAHTPDDADIRTHHGLALRDLGRGEEALADFDHALVLQPGNALALLYRGNLLLEAGRPDEALASYDRLLAIAPGYDEAWFRRGGALWLMDRFEDALASYCQALAINPNRFAAAFNSGTALLKLERYDDALAAFEKAAALAPDHRYLPGVMAGAISGACDFGRWDGARVRVIEAVKSRASVIAPLTFLPFCDDGGLRRACSEAFAADQVPETGVPLWNGERHVHDRIRIAYLSSDFHQHATAELIAGLIENHDRQQFEVTGISFSRDDASPMRARMIKAFDHFEDVRVVSDADVARLLREREIDIAVDLKGHTEGARAGILAHRPCPVQVNYLGYPGTIGAPWLDYIIGDAVVLPFSDQASYSEKIVHLPHCYQANDARRAIAETAPSRAEAGLPEKALVFCCFNAAWKITPAIFDVWMRLLKALPDSVLWLLEDNASMTGHLRAAAAARGVDGVRLVFAGRAAPPAHLARHRLADLFLDTLPYGAHTTASDALWTGLPLLTCLGRQFDGRVAASLLKTMGLPELVTASLEDYEALALALARSPEKLAEIATRLAANRLSGPLYDVVRFARSIEAAYLRMIEISHNGGQPQSFTIPA
ncbi:MAG TPA: tetratricopeptide repeat protein [Rhizomicrobium sp.]|nr:tetratricopeptide repeat protein [Rhizomicrobium sp.]